jgi:DNA-binding NtrC family response regulator
VRELENALGHASMMVMNDTIDVQDLPEYLRAPAASCAAGSEPTTEAAPIPTNLALEDHQRQLVVRALETAGGNQSQAARLLRIGRDALRYKLKKHNLQI